MKEKLKIFVACHKPGNAFVNLNYIPIHVGRDVSTCTAEMKSMIGDNTGDNISKKNPTYCELTAQYWIWKNIHNVQYIGLSHYRRYFQHKLTDVNVDDIFLNHDVILCRPYVSPYSVLTRLFRASCEEDVYIFMNILKDKLNDLYPIALAYLNGNKVVPFNMFVMKKESFDEFCKWEFAILDEFETTIKFSSYARRKRVIGLFAEVLLPIYCFCNKYSIKYDDVVPMIGDKVKNSIKHIFHNLLNNVRYLVAPRERFDDPAVYVGLKNDGIRISENLLQNK